VTGGGSKGLTGLGIGMSIVAALLSGSAAFWVHTMGPESVSVDRTKKGGEHIGDSIGEKKKQLTSITLDYGESCIVYTQGNVTCSYTVFNGPMIVKLHKGEWPHFFIWTHPLGQARRYPWPPYIVSTRVNKLSVSLENLKTLDDKKLFLYFDLFYQMKDIYTAATAIDDPIAAFKSGIIRGVAQFLHTREYEDFRKDKRMLSDINNSETFKPLALFAETVGFSLSKITCSDYKLPFSFKYLGKIIRSKKSTKKDSDAEDEDDLEIVEEGEAR